MVLKKTNEVSTELEVKLIVHYQGQKEEFQILKEIKEYSNQEMLYVEHLKPIIEMVEVKLKEMKLKFERQLLEEQIARLKVEEEAKTREVELHILSIKKMLKLQDEGKAMAIEDQSSSGCVIL